MAPAPSGRGSGAPPTPRATGPTTTRTRHAWPPRPIPELHNGRQERMPAGGCRVAEKEAASSEREERWRDCWRAAHPPTQPRGGERRGGGARTAVMYWYSVSPLTPTRPWSHGARRGGQAGAASSGGKSYRTNASAPSSETARPPRCEKDRRRPPVLSHPCGHPGTRQREEDGGEMSAPPTPPSRERMNEWF